MSGRADRLLDLAYDAIFTFALDTGRITHWNRGAERIYGWSAEEAIGQRPEELLASIHDATRAELIRTVVDGGTWEGRLVQARRDGGPVVVDARWQLERDDAGKPVGVLEVNRDVTAEWSSATEARLILDSIQHAAVVLLDDGGRIRRWNRGAERILGWASEEVVGNGLPRGVRIELGEAEGWLPRKSGGRIWASISASVLTGPRGTAEGMVVVVRDLTEQRHVVERNLAHERAKSEFLNLAAHELRSPVTVIAGYLSMLAEGTIGAPDAETRRVVHLLRGKVAELSDMIEEMVEVARVEEGSVELHVERIELNQLVGDAVEASALLVGPRHRLNVSRAAAPVVVHGDRRRLHLVIASLLSNAVKFSPDGGEVECRVRVDQGRAAIDVEDHGVGITAAELRRIFDRFERGAAVRPSAGGPGLGLYLARALARLHGGDVTVRSTPGRGSTFTLWLPLAPASVVGASA